jgi:metallophosphoesterase superfamily enzyme
LSKRDYRTAAKNLNKLNKFYNSNEEIKAIKGNYDAWQDAIKEQKKRLVGKNADLSQKQY